MKTKYINLLYIFLVVFISGCSLDDVEVNDQGEILEDFLVQDEITAKSVLNKVYQGFRSYDEVRFSAGLMVAGIEQTFVYDSFEINGFKNNNVQANTATISDDIYTKLYYIINTSNYLITQVEAGKAGAEVTEETKNAILGEAKTLRALARFKLLRVFGQFYDMDSQYGIAISNKPVTFKDRIPRSSVKESYNFIIDDLKFGINNNLVKNNFDENGDPAENNRYYVTKTTAQAILAKVYLYQKKYAEAQSLANDVINNVAGYSLEPTYAGIFNKKWESPEVLFAPYTNGNTQTYTGPGQYGDEIIQPTTSFKTLADSQVPSKNGDSFTYLEGYDPRFIFSYKRLDQDTPGAPNTQNHKYPFSEYEKGNTIYYLRMAEVYLIYAEAYVRNPANSNYANAVAKVNDVRRRANTGIGTTSISLITSTTKEAVLKDIRNEKMLELFLETGETWFDIVRYIDSGDLTFADINKVTLTNKNQLIFPIPLKARGGNSNLVQNPGY